MKILPCLLGLGDEQVFSLVVFVGDSTFKTPVPDNVTHGHGYICFIKSQTEELLSNAAKGASGAGRFSKHVF